MTDLILRQGAQTVLRLSQTMLAAAQQQEWQEFAALEKERSQVMNQLFSHPQMSLALDYITDTLQRVIDLDRSSIEIGQGVQDRLADELTTLNQGRRAITAYHKHSH